MRGIRGTINVFVALMMIPTIAFTGMMVDFARINMASVQANNAADLSASAVIAYYDGLLKDVYGLYAVSQEKESGRYAYEVFAEEYARAALSLDAEGKKSEASFNLFSSGKSVNPLDVKVETSSKYSLRNSAYMKYQIEQYMKYRVTFSLIGALDNLVSQGSDLGQMGEKAKSDMSFIENEYKSIETDIYEIYQLYKELYEAINNINDKHTETKTGLQDIEESINEKLHNIHENYAEIQSNPAAAASVLMWSAIRDDAEDIKRDINQAKGLTAAYQLSIENIRTKAREIETKTMALEVKIDTAKADLKNEKGKKYSSMFVGSTVSNPPSDDFGMYAQLQKMKENLIQGVGTAGDRFYNENSGQINKVNDKLNGVKYGAYTLDEVITNARNGITDEMPPAPLIVNPKPSVSNLSDLQFKPFDSAVYNTLKAEAEKTGGMSESEANDMIARAETDESAARQTVENMSNAQVRDREIPSGFSSAWDGEQSHSGTDDIWIEELTVNRLLLVEYGVQMFTDYTTNNRRVSGGGYYKNKQEDTLSGIPLSSKMNYMYRSELEYLLCGRDSASENLNIVYGILFAMFFVSNFIFTFRDSLIAGTIELIYLIPIVGPALAEAYRLLITGVETWRDLDRLLNGKKVPLLKTPNLLPSQWQTYPLYEFYNVYNDPGIGVGMYYYEYLRLLILFNFTADNNELTHRITNLIELNMNSYKQGIGTGNLSNRDRFNASEAFTVVDVNLNGSMPYFFIPMPFISGQGSSSSKYSFNVSKTRGY